MPYLNDTETPYLTLIGQGSTPANAPAGDVRLFLDATSNTLYTVDSAGVRRVASQGQMWAPISNGNPAAPCICNSAGTIIVSRRA